MQSPRFLCGSGDFLMQQDAETLQEISERFDRLAVMAGAVRESVGDNRQVEAKANAVRLSIKEIGGKLVVWVDEDVLAGKPTTQSNSSFIRTYLAQHINDVYTILESRNKVYPAKRLPDEYLRSKSAQNLANFNRSLFRAKLRMVPGIDEMIKIATNRRAEKTRHTHNKNAKYGVYRYDARVAFQGSQTIEAYTAELVILNASDGRKYLYDIVNIKKDAVTANGLKVQARRAKNFAQQTNNVNNNNIPKSAANSNPSKKLSLRDQMETPEFQRWFGNSIVLNEDGSPHPLLPTGVISVTWPLAASTCTCHTATPS